jgi:hypothetical protein
MERSGRGLLQKLFLNFLEGVRKIMKSQETQSPVRELNPDALNTIQEAIYFIPMFGA